MCLHALREWSRTDAERRLHTLVMSSSDCYLSPKTQKRDETSPQTVQLPQANAPPGFISSHVNRSPAYKTLKVISKRLEVTAHILFTCDFMNHRGQKWLMKFSEVEEKHTQTRAHTHTVWVISKQTHFPNHTDLSIMHSPTHGFSVHVCCSWCLSYCISARFSYIYQWRSWSCVFI